MPVAAAVVGGAVLGGGAGSQKDVATSNSRGSSSIDVAPAGAQENSARDTAFNAIGSLDQRLKTIEGSGALNNLDKLLQELGQNPNQQRIDQANQLTESLFAPQQTQLNQAFETQNQQYAARAAQLGRSSADPILAARLAQEQIRQQANLNAQKGAFSAQEAFNAPSRLFQTQLSGLSGLSGQAIQNRQAVYSLGSDFANAERNFRFQTATRFNSEARMQESGGGLKGALTGILGGAAAGASLGNSLSGAPSKPGDTNSLNGSNMAGWIPQQQGGFGAFDQFGGFNGYGGYGMGRRY